MAFFIGELFSGYLYLKSMSSAGHIADMLVRMENNRALLKHHKRYRDIIELHSLRSLNKPLEWKTLDDDERRLLISHLEEVLRNERRNDWKAALISIVITFGIVGLLVALFQWLFV